MKFFNLFLCVLFFSYLNAEERKIGNITFTGQRWWSENQLQRILDLYSGETLDKEKIKNNTAWLNQNVFHKSKLKFTVSKERPGYVDIEVKTKDRFPFRFYTSINNNGTKVTGRQRILGGITWGNAFFNNDVLTYEGTVSNIPSRYVSHTGNYLTFLPWKHKFSLFGNYSKTTPEIQDHNNVSFSNQLRARYIIPFLPLYTKFQQSVSLGFDLKYSNSYSLNTKILDAVAKIKKLQVAQLVGNFYLYSETKSNNFSLNYNLYVSPGTFLPRQSVADFERKRNFSRPCYSYFNFIVTDIYHLPKKYELATQLTVQGASRTLPSSELISIGGYNTVRGYKPCEFSGDNGLIANLEVRTPSFNPFFCKDKLLFLTFLDYGIANNYKREHRVIPVGKKEPQRTQYALGTGFGLRYNIEQYLSLRLDYGFKLHKMHSVNKVEKALRRGKGEWHAGLLLAY